MQEYFKPIITPFELEIAIGADRSWTGKYILDFGRLLERSISSGMQCGTSLRQARPDVCHAASRGS